MDNNECHRHASFADDCSSFESNINDILERCIVTRIDCCLNFFFETVIDYDQLNTLISKIMKTF